MLWGQNSQNECYIQVYVSRSSQRVRVRVRCVGKTGKGPPRFPPPPISCKTETQAPFVNKCPQLLHQPPYLPHRGTTSTAIRVVVSFSPVPEPPDPPTHPASSTAGRHIDMTAICLVASVLYNRIYYLSYYCRDPDFPCIISSQRSRDSTVRCCLAF